MSSSHSKSSSCILRRQDCRDDQKAKGRERRDDELAGQVCCDGAIVITEIGAGTLFPFAAWYCMLLARDLSIPEISFPTDGEVLATGARSNVAGCVLFARFPWRWGRRRKCVGCALPAHHSVAAAPGRLRSSRLSNAPAAAFLIVWWQGFARRGIRFTADDLVPAALSKINLWQGTFPSRVLLGDGT